MADAAVVTGGVAEARSWAERNDLNWDDLLYVALSRARYDAIVLETSPRA